MSILGEIFRGELEPQYDCNRKDPELKAIESKIQELTNCLENKLSKESADILENLTDKQYELTLYLQEKSFAYGIKLAVTVMHEIC